MFSRANFIGPKLLQLRFWNPGIAQEVIGFRQPTDLCNLDDFTRSTSSYNDVIFCGLYSRRIMNGKVPRELLQVLSDLARRLNSIDWWQKHHGNLETYQFGNLRPQNIMVRYCDTDVGGCLKEDVCMTDWNWKAPEALLGRKMSLASDMFTFGCIIFYCITGGSHPFGEDPDQCDENIMLNNPVNLSQLADMPEALHLVRRLLNPEPKLRPEAWVVWKHPLFWCPLQRLLFLNHTRMLVDSVRGRTDTMIFEMFKSNAPAVVDPMWVLKIKSLNVACENYIENILRICEHARDDNRIYESCPRTMDLQDVLGPRRSYTDAFYPRLFVNLYEITRELYTVQEWFDEFWMI